MLLILRKEAKVVNYASSNKRKNLSEKGSLEPKKFAPHYAKSNRKIIWEKHLAKAKFKPILEILQYIYYIYMHMEQIAIQFEGNPLHQNIKSRYLLSRFLVNSNKLPYVLSAIPTNRASVSGLKDTPAISPNKSIS